MNRTMPMEAREPLDLRIDISRHVDGLSGEASMAANLYLPSDENLQGHTPQTLVTLVHGGSYTRRYWDLIVPGYHRDDYSLAHYLAQQGYIVLSFDNLGMGESHTSLNGFELTTAMMAQAIVATTHIVRQQLGDGTLLKDIPITVAFAVLIAHSMGSYLSALAQARFRAFDAIVIEGYGGGAMTDGLFSQEAMQQAFQPDERGYIHISSRLLHFFFHGNFQPPAEVIAEDDKHMVVTPTKLVSESFQISEVFRDCVSQIAVPVLLVYGEQDVAANPFGELAFYSSSPSKSLYIHAGSAHCGNLAPTRRNLWRVLARFIPWAQALASESIG